MALLGSDNPINCNNFSYPHLKLQYETLASVNIWMVLSYVLYVKMPYPNGNTGQKTTAAIELVVNRSKFLWGYVWLDVYKQCPRQRLSSMNNSSL